MKNIFLGIVVFLTSAVAYSQVDRSIVPTPGPAPEIQIADPIVFDLDNGMKVILSINNKIPKVSFNLVMGSDPRLEGKKAGLSDLMGDLLLSGTTHRSKDSIDFETDFIGADLYASNSSIYLNVLTKHLDKGLDVMTDIMQNANFPESEFDRIKKQYESGLYAAISDPNTMMTNAISKVVFTDQHPYGEVMTEETLNNITRQDVVDLYKEQFTPAGSYLVIVGDIDEAKAKEIAQKRFGNWEGGVPYERDYSTGYYPSGNRVFFIEKPGAVQSVVSVAFPVNIRPGDENQIKLEVLNSLFGGSGFGTRLMQNLREDKAYTYGAYSNLKINRKGSYLYANGNFRNDVTDSAIVQFLYEFNNIISEAPTEKELSLTKATVAGSFARSLESPRTIANFALNIFRNDLPADYYKTYLQKLSAVSPDDILEVAKEYFTSKQLNIIVVGNKDILESLRLFSVNERVIILDAFGNPAKEKEYLPSDLTKTEVFEKYLMAVTKTSNFKKAKKKINKIKSLEQETTVTINQAGIEMKAKNYFKSPNMSAEKIELMGMTIQEEVFNGEKGVSKTMNQMGGIDKKEYSSEEVEDKKKTAAVFPEFSLVCCNKDDFKLLGIEKREGKEPMYVIEYNIGETKTTEYYNSKTFLKEYSEKLEITEEGPQSMSTIYSGYEDFKGYLFPTKVSQLVESISMSGTIKELKINGKIDDSVFKVD